MLFRSVLFILVLALSPFEVTRGAMADTYKSTETPAYTVQRAEGAIEVRAYGPRLMAEVSVSGSQGQAVSTGFRTLAAYIFGANEGGAKLAMTSPVTQVPGQTIAMTTPVTQMARDGSWLVQFMMPSGQTLATLPANRQIMLQFSGIAGARILAAKEGELRSWARGQAMKVTAGPFYYFYDPPWTLPWNRRNEVAFWVE